MADNENKQGIEPLNGAFLANLNKIVIFRKNLQKAYL
jgi:hypothetical protein